MVERVLWRFGPGLIYSNSLSVNPRILQKGTALFASVIASMVLKSPKVSKTHV